MNAVITAENLSKWYGHILGVSEINLEIRPGIKGLLGPNGAGKSTFLKLVSGQLKPSIGKIRVLGEDVFANPDVFSRIGVCPEADSFYPDMTGGEFTLFMAHLHGFEGGQAKTRAGEALEKVGLQDNAHRQVKAYSFGMRQRLRLAACLVHDPEVLLLDEPLRGIDPLWRIRISKMLKELEAEGKTVVVSSHILPEVEGLTEEIVLIHQGKVFAQGDIHTIRNLLDDHPHQIFVRCDRARLLAERMIGHPAVRSVSLDGENGLTLSTDRQDPCFEALTQAIAEQDLAVEELTSPDDNLQAIFDYLVGR